MSATACGSDNSTSDDDIRSGAACGAWPMPQAPFGSGTAHRDYYTSDDLIRSGAACGAWPMPSGSGTVQWGDDNISKLVLPNPACGIGEMPCPTMPIEDERPLQISFSLLKYDSKTARKLTFNEYKRCICQDWYYKLGEETLFITESSHCALLFYVFECDDLHRLYNLNWLIRHH